MRYVLLVVVGLMLLALVGCGGSGSGGNNNQDTGGLTGQLNATNAADYNILVDGQPLSAAPSANGRFSIPNLPAGHHTISLVSGSGMAGAHMGVDVIGGQVTDVGDVVPTAGGQIVGLVSRVNEDNTTTRLAGVEVIADPEPIYVVMGARQTSMPPVRDGGDLQLTAITDDNGSFVIPAVPEGGYVVTVNVPGLMQGVAYVWVSPDTTSTADFQLQIAVDPGVGTVLGHVFAAGEAGSAPLEGAMVSIYSDGEWRPTPEPDPVPLTAAVKSLAMSMMPPDANGVIAPPYYFDQFSTLTAADGSYSLNVPSGHLQINVWAEGFEPAYDTVTLQPQATETRDFTLNQWVEPPPPVDGGGGGTDPGTSG